MKEVSERPELLEKIAERLRALGDPVRIRLLLQLQSGSANVNELAKRVGIRQASASKHLGLLRQVGIIQLKKVGTQSIYRVEDASVFQMCKIVCDGVSRHVKDEAAAVTGGANATLKRRRRSK